MVFQCISGIGMATSVRVSNSLGANLPRTARRATVAGLIITLVFEGVAVALVAGFHEQLPWAMTGVPSVVAAASSLLPVVALGLMGDGVNSCIQVRSGGGLWGCGAGHWGAGAVDCDHWLAGRGEVVAAVGCVLCARPVGYLAMRRAAGATLRAGSAARRRQAGAGRNLQPCQL